MSLLNVTILLLFFSFAARTDSIIYQFVAANEYRIAITQDERGAHRAFIGRPSWMWKNVIAASVSDAEERYVNLELENEVFHVISIEFESDRVSLIFLAHQNGMMLFEVDDERLTNLPPGFSYHDHVNGCPTSLAAPGA